MRIIGAVALAHLINDLIQSVLPSIYPMLKANYGLTFTQVGLITLTFQLTASLLQPWVGYHTDRHPKPWLLPAGIGVHADRHRDDVDGRQLPVDSAGGGADRYRLVDLPPGSLARWRDWPRADALVWRSRPFRSAVTPVRRSARCWRRRSSFRSARAMWPGSGCSRCLRCSCCTGISRWYANHLNLFKLKAGQAATHGLSKGRVISALVVLGLLVFSKYFYMASLTSYFTFYLIEKFDLSVASSQLHLFLFLGAVAAGTFFGGPIGDKIGRKAVIWFSILGVAPFTLLLPHVDLFWTSVLSVVIGFILASAFSAIVVYAQELVPGNVGMIAGVFFGLMFGFGGIGAALLGHLADIHGIEYVYFLCSFLPLFGVLAIFLPRTKKA